VDRSAKFGRRDIWLLVILRRVWREYVARRVLPN